MSAHEVEAPLEMPKDWELASQEGVDGCRPINGVYRNHGIGTFGERQELGVVRLDAALGRAVPPPQEPELVEVSYDTQDQTLNFRYRGGEEPYEFEEAVRCDEGWLVWNKSLSDQYLADGVTLEDSEQSIRLIEGAGSDLIVHSRGKAVYTTALVAREKETTERWSKFERAGPLPTPINEAPHP